MGQLRSTLSRSFLGPDCDKENILFSILSMGCENVDTFHVYKTWNFLVE